MISRENVKEELKFEKKESKATEEKVEKKLKGDYGFDSHYYNGANHMAAECMLRKREEKKDRVKDEAYYVEWLEEVRTRMKAMYLVAKESVDGDGTYQIWSSGSDDEEIRKPTHGFIYEKYK